MLLSINRRALTAFVCSRSSRLKAYKDGNRIGICHSRVCLAGPQCLNRGLPSAMCVWCHCIYSFDFHHSSLLKREYVTAAVTFKKRSFEATLWLLLSVPVCTAQRGEPSFQLASLLFEFYSKCIRNIWIGYQPSKLPTLQDTSVVVVAFKCQTGLDT